MPGEFDEIRGRLEGIAEELADLAIQRLKESIDAGGSELPVDERRLTLGVGSSFAIAPTAIGRLQSLTRNRFRFGDGKIVVDLPPGNSSSAMPLLRALLEAL